jgi:flap endonuclease GEN
MLQYLGMPVLWANGETEALCAQLINEGHVDACITSDSGAFLFGAKTVIKVLRSNCIVSILF